MKRQLLAVTLVASAALPAVAQEGGAKPRRRPPPERFEELLEPVREKHGVPALAAATIYRGEVNGIGVVGVRKHGADAKVTIDDKWHIGSCTKSMTATLVARLIGRGRLSWKTTLAEAFPDLKESMDPAYRDVTLELLLTNRSGAPKDLDADGLWTRLWARKGTPVEQRRELLEGVLSRPPQVKPGTKKVYSNAGFAIAGHVAETKLGKPWEDLLRREVFEPLRMKSAGYGAPGSPKKIDQPWGHRPTEKDPLPVPPGPLADNPPSIGPAGTVHCSLPDWAKYVAVHARMRAGKRVITNTDTLRKLHANPEGSNYAFGWVVTRHPKSKVPVFWHNGSNTSWYAFVWVAPEWNFAAMAVCNMGGPNGEKACGEMVRTLVSRFVEARPKKR